MGFLSFSLFYDIYTSYSTFVRTFYMHVCACSEGMDIFINSINTFNSLNILIFILLTSLLMYV